MPLGLSSRPLVSVPLCTYNGAAHLAAQIDSVLAQTRGNLEVVAVDDASSDRSPEILRAYAARDTRVRISINDRNLGYNANFGRAFALCSGEYIAPCDQDDIWRPDKLAVLTEAIGEADLAYGDSEFMDAAEQPAGRLSDMRRMYSGRDPLALVLTNSVSGHALLCRRDLIERASPFPAATYYDWWLAIVAAAGRGIRYVDIPLVRFRRHSRTVTTLSGLPTDAPPVGIRQLLSERRRLLQAMTRLDCPRKKDIEEFEQALGEGLDAGRWRRFLSLAWRHRSGLTYVLRPRLPSLAWRSLRDMLRAGGTG